MEATAGMMALDLLGRPITVGARVATSTLSYKQAHTRVGTVKEFGEDYAKRTALLVALDGPRARSIWKSPSDLVVVA